MNATAQEATHPSSLVREDYLNAYLKDGWKQVPGWLYNGAPQLIRMIDLFQKQCGFEGHLGEIGLFQGKLFILLALMAREEEKVAGIDLFEAPMNEGNDRSTGLVLANFDHDGLTMLHENMRQHMPEYPWVEILKSDSTQVGAAQLQELVGGKYRLFSIDGGHEEEVVFHDLSIVAESIAPGGVIVVDDYFDQGNPAVSVATCRYVFQPNQNLAPFAAASNKLFLCEKDSHEAYYRQFSSINTDAIHCKTEMFGSKVVIYKF